MKIRELLPTLPLPDRIAALDAEALTDGIGHIDGKTLFFLTEGVSYEKKKLLPFILAKKPLAIVTSEEDMEQQTDVPIVYTDSVRRAYAEAYCRFCGLAESKMKLVAVTGTNGKTTTATMLAAILRHQRRKVGFIGTGRILSDGKAIASPYYSMTTPDPAILYPALKRMREDGCEAVIMEASSHALALEKLAPLHFDAAIFTNLSEEHLDFHRDMEEYYQAKARLFKMTETAFINTDDPYGKRLYRECTCQKVSIGALYEADIMAKSILGDGGTGASYIYKTAGPTFSVKLALSGTYQVYNSMLALAAAIWLGVPPCQARRAIESIRRVPGRLERITESRVKVYLDYAHTPEALRSSLTDIRKGLSRHQRLWLVFGCGGERDRKKRPEMARIAESLADRVILTLDNCRAESPMQILHDTVQGFAGIRSVRIISNREKAIRHALLAMDEKDTLIIAGKGHESYSIDKDGYHPFDERKIVLDALKERKGGHTLLYEDPTDTPLHRT